ncbi:unnamed protein product [Blepharisma stoltei]|uniref:Uncharacterized protein n=1 Tax=Blepharisma stoltei TaxID=1481888 RepID=A0AAU9JRU8_9CILI|nr:unnamed protein product [Blepharisma stoltei]
MDRLIEYLNRKIAVTATEISKDFGVSLGEARKMLFNYIQNYESNFNCIYSSFDPSNRKFSLITEEQMFNCSMCEIEAYGIVRENYDKIILPTNSYKLRDDPPLGNHKKGVLVSTLPVVKIENRIQKDGTPAITTGKKLKRNSLDFILTLQNE